MAKPKDQDEAGDALVEELESDRDAAVDVDEPAATADDIDEARSVPVMSSARVGASAPSDKARRGPRAMARDVVPGPSEPGHKDYPVAREPDGDGYPSAHDPGA